MATVGYCGECGRYVELTGEGACPNGHPRSSLRDVREGTLARVPATAAPQQAGVSQAAMQQDVDFGDDGAYRQDGGLAAQIIGKSIVLVPIALIVAWGLWTGFEQAKLSTGSVSLRMFYSVISLLATVGVAFIIARRHSR